MSAHGAKVYQSLETPLGRVLDATPDFDRTGSSYEANLGASWGLDVFGGLRRGREAARAEYAASEAGAVATRLAVAAHTADVYVAIRVCERASNRRSRALGGGWDARRAGGTAPTASVDKQIHAHPQSTR